MATIEKNTEPTQEDSAVVGGDTPRGGEGTEGRTAHVRRVPLGPIAGITPFNFPLNLVAHKVAPALAAGCPIVLRPASQTPISSLKLAEIILESGWPEEAFAVVPSTTRDAS